MPTLMVQIFGFPPVSHVLKDETTTIGRMKGNTIVIEDASISLMHAKITRKDGHFYLKDLNSTNGTLVNGQPVTECRLRDLDRLRFAEVPAQFMAEASLQPAKAAPEAVAPTPAPAPVQAPPVATALSTPMKVLGLPPGTASTPVGVQTETRAITQKQPTRSRTPMPRLVLAFGTTAVLAVIGFGAWKFIGANREPSPGDAKERIVALANAGQPRRVQSLSFGAVTNRNASTPSAGSQEANLSVEQLIKELKKEDVTERRKAAAGLHALGAEAKPASVQLRESLKDSDQEVQMWAALTLVNNQAYDPAAIPVLVLSLQHEDAMLRQVACLSLALIPYQEKEKDAVIPALAEAAGKDAEEEVRQAAKSALGIIAPELLGKTGD